MIGFTSALSQLEGRRLTLTSTLAPQICKYIMRMVLMEYSTQMTDVQNRWVFSSELSPPQQVGHKIYDPSKSSTAQPMPGYTWSIEYLDESSASGNVYTDTVSVGATEIENQAVELAQVVSSQIMGEPSDGILGLAVIENNSMSGLMFT
jgi:Eukaryotic aspartyl protease